MASGDTTTITLADSMVQLRQSAAIQREGSLGFQNTVRKEQLGKGEGNAWNHVVLDKLTAQRGLGETQRLDNAQAMTDVIFSIEPQTTGIYVVLSRKMQDRIARAVFTQTGALMQNAINRQIHLDGLSLYDSASFSQPGTGTFTSGVMAALSSQMDGNTIENPPEGDPKHAWLNPYQIHDLSVQIGAPVGTYTIQPGPTQDAYLKGISAIQVVGGFQVHPSTNVRVDSSTLAHGGGHAKSMVVMVEEAVPRVYAEDVAALDGARAMRLFESYEYGVISSGVGTGRFLSDATAPIA